jgi:hypothetical protein
VGRRQHHQVALESLGHKSAFAQQLAETRRDRQATFVINGVLILTEEHLFYLLLLMTNAGSAGEHPPLYTTLTHLQLYSTEIVDNMQEPISLIPD